MTSSASRVFYNLAAVEGAPNTVTFQVKPTLVSYVNTLRRMVLIGVESVAFRSDMNDKGATTDVVVTENTTPMTNEMLADRIGLLPIHVEDPSTWNPDEYIFRLNVVNETSDTKPVLASDFEVLRKGRPEEDPVPVPNTKFFHPDPISKDTALIAILKGRQSNQNPQKISLTAKATVGTGRQHIRFCPVSQCAYSYTIDTDEARQQQFFESWLRNSKKVEFKSLEQDAARKEALEREFQTMAVQRCFLVNEKGEPYSFDFTIETMGIQSVANIVGQALKNLAFKFRTYANIDKGDLPEGVRVQPPDKPMKGFEFIFKGEDHTLANALQTWMDDNLMETGEITFVGYKTVHPLVDEVVIDVGVEDGKEITARTAIAKAATALATMFDNWREDWTRFSAGPIGKRTLPSLKPNLQNAKAMEDAAERVRIAEAPAAAATAKKSAFYGKKQATATGVKK